MAGRDLPLVVSRRQASKLDARPSTAVDVVRVHCSHVREYASAIGRCSISCTILQAKAVGAPPPETPEILPQRKQEKDAVSGVFRWAVLARRALSRTRTGDPLLTMEVLYQLS